MYKRVSTPAVMVFCEKHNVIFDWILAGDLAGLQRMTREHKDQVGGRPESKWVNFLRVALETIPPDQRRATIEVVMKTEERQ